MADKKLTMRDANAIRYLYKHKSFTTPKLADMFVVGECAISRIITNKCYYNARYNPDDIPTTPLFDHYLLNIPVFECSYKDAYTPIYGRQHYILGKDGSVFSDYGLHYTRLSVFFHRQGYPMVQIGNEKVLIHRLLAQHFLPNPGFLPYTTHINDIPTDNRLSNLRWGTPSSNMFDRYKNHALRQQAQMEAEDKLAEEPSSNPINLFEGMDFTKQINDKLSQIFPGFVSENETEGDIL
jgi:hypothetical protein